MRSDYDYKTTGCESGMVIDYGFVNGSSKVIFIKAGLDGSVYGFENKYLDIADRLNTLYGYTVMVVSNPSGSKNALEEGVKVLKAYLERLGCTTPVVSYMGFSNGAYLGFTEGYKYGFESYLLINSPLMINYHKISVGLRALNNHRVLIAYSEHDPSFKYSEMLRACLPDTAEIRIIPGTDHQFRGKTEIFKALPIEFFKPQA